MKAATLTRKAKAARLLPAKPPGTKDDLRQLLRLLYGATPKKLAGPLFPTIRRIASQALARERLCRASKGAGPGLEALAKAREAVSALIEALEAIPPPLDTIVAHRLRNHGFQEDSLRRLEAVLEGTDAWSRTMITGSPTGNLAMGPGDLVTRLDCDGADYLIREAVCLFSTFRGDAAISADPAGCQATWESGQAAT